VIAAKEVQTVYLGSTGGRRFRAGSGAGDRAPRCRLGSDVDRRGPLARRRGGGNRRYPRAQGVGKSTRSSSSSDTGAVHAGGIRLNGTDIASLRAYQRDRLGLGYVLQHREVFPSLTVAEHIGIAQHPGRWTRELVGEISPAVSDRCLRFLTCCGASGTSS
jgi:hypothetical protein